ncbi:hypothetical protein Tsubulata_011943 [Turnera subulata]|uniref:RING-type domain-containing protein n=1 Tax=Turnera subulata TaxID=218843 RepID=A0A9Q0JRM0_9ROSI|nr:hypothetical protein Tsubulata_011943 [Turnera subulata]
MEGGCGGNRRLTLLDHMSNSAVVVADKRARAQVNKTLLDIIREEEQNGGSLFGHKEKTWKAFRERLRLKRAGSAWTSSVHTPTSDIPIENNNNNNSSSGSNKGRFGTSNNSRSFMNRRSSVRFTTVPSSRQLGEAEGGGGGSGGGPRPQMVRRMSVRFGEDGPNTDIGAVDEGPPQQSFRPQFSRRGSVRFSSDSEGISLGAAVAEERSMSAREAVAAQEAAEAARNAADDDDEDDDHDEEKDEGGSGGGEEEEEEEEEDEDGGGDGGAPAMRMSLMDLLEETDRQMGVVGSSYKMEEYGDEEEEEEEEDDDEEGGAGGEGVERTCCVCMVRHKGSAFIPCGHTFCRLCSRELMVQRGNCPLCNGYILEILDIF